MFLCFPSFTSYWGGVLQSGDHISIMTSHDALCTWCIRPLKPHVWNIFTLYPLPWLSRVLTQWSRSVTPGYKISSVTALDSSPTDSDAHYCPPAQHFSFRVGAYSASKNNNKSVPAGVSSCLWNTGDGWGYVPYQGWYKDDWLFFSLAVITEVAMLYYVYIFIHCSKHKFSRSPGFGGIKWAMYCISIKALTSSMYFHTIPGWGQGKRHCDIHQLSELEV